MEYLKAAWSFVNQQYPRPRKADKFEFLISRKFSMQENSKNS